MEYKTKIGHAHLKVADLERSIAFYQRFLKLDITQRIGAHFAFLSGNDMHHELALQQVGPEAPRPHPYGIGLYHVAFEVPSGKDLALAFRTLREAGIDVSPVNHFISWALYFSDPDGNGLEIYWDTRAKSFGKKSWSGYSEAISEQQLDALL
ncbi:MAG: VOC family protein [Deferribacteres bacterium]|nr:VOC family protein [candidate division KSB1 bacterium]MCB9510134.1 VOC family protein [Deferribacteres bacterium]